MTRRHALTHSLLAALSLLATISVAPAGEASQWPDRPTVDHVLVQTGFYTTHFSNDPEHTSDQGLISLELHTPERWFAGGARFRNSFNQDSHYLYAGRAFPLWQAGDVSFRVKLTAGLLHGYRGEYRDKIPFNRLGVAPAVLPTLGARWRRAETDLIVFGTAGLMITAGWRF